MALHAYILQMLGLRRDRKWLKARRQRSADLTNALASDCSFIHLENVIATS